MVLQRDSNIFYKPTHANKWLAYYFCCVDSKRYRFHRALYYCIKFCHIVKEIRMLHRILLISHEETLNNIVIFDAHYSSSIFWRKSFSFFSEKLYFCSHVYFCGTSFFRFPQNVICEINNEMWPRKRRYSTSFVSVFYQKYPYHKNVHISKIAIPQK